MLSNIAGSPLPPRSNVGGDQTYHPLGYKKHTSFPLLAHPWMILSSPLETFVVVVVNNNNNTCMYRKLILRSSYINILN